MASNQFGTLFRITTWGESHGKAVGVVIDGCPAGLELSDADLNAGLKQRQPGQSPYVTSRKESDAAQIYSGLFEGKTTGAPISIIIFNEDADASKYEPIKHLLRPGHAHFTYLEKYGIFDYRGGGRSSARETVCRVAAGAVAKKILAQLGVEMVAFLKAVGGVTLPEMAWEDPHSLRKATAQSPLFCPDLKWSEEMARLISQAKEEGDSLGGVIESIAYGLPSDWGDPVYEKLEANLAKAMLSIPASKGFEIGSGFGAASMRGSLHNDRFFLDSDQKTRLSTNYSGGTLGGISTGMPLVIRVPFKPTSSIMKPQETVDAEGKAALFQLPEGSRHDPCVAIRAVPIVEAMMALVLVDALLMQRCARL